ncbi:TolC family protein [Leptolyngbya sp. FACHB-261]|uniref:TolC family protein n=1 Tax=Leptolyngbya sp. FACHB-261 TaxID=2692806 RepID=UPI0016864898|nr:TolC family protein [Leptolyngbya sp. FACHB-261]MBD2103358.1 TolC family protein [Leptolyngbya sp. FACHB-261]
MQIVRHLIALGMGTALTLPALEATAAPLQQPKSRAINLSQTAPQTTPQTTPQATPNPATSPAAQPPAEQSGGQASDQPAGQSADQPNRPASGSSGQTSGQTPVEAAPAAQTQTPTPQPSASPASPDTPGTASPSGAPGATDQAPANQAPADQAPANQTPGTPTPASQSATDLSPNPDPLSLPTQPFEVRVETTQGISLQQALELATRNNRQLEQARTSLERARAALREQEAQLYPTASTSVQTQYVNRPGNEAAGGLEDGTADLSGNLGLDYTILDFGRRRYNIESASTQVRDAQLEVDRINQSIRSDISGLYYDLQNAAEQVRIQQAAVEASQISVRDALAQERAGVGTRFATLQAQTQLADDQVQLLEAQNNLLISRRQLAQRLDIAQTATLEAVDPIEVSGTWNLGLEETILAAYANRVELQQFLLRRDVAQNQARAAQTTLLPQIALSGGYNFNETLLGQSNDSDSIFSRNTESFQDSFTVGVTLRWTLFNGGATQAQVAQARADEAIAESQFAEQRSQVRFDVENAFFSLQSRREQITAARVGVESAQEGLRLARLRFQAGVGTQLEVTNSQRDLTEAQSNLAQSVIGYNRALAQLQRSVNQL